mgnify:CR=1 FL=1
MDTLPQLRQHLRRGRKGGEEHIPVPELAAQFRLALHDDGLHALLGQAQGRLHACRTAAYDNHSFLHHSLMS